MHSKIDKLYINSGLQEDLDEALLEDVITEEVKKRQLLVYNDDHNSFDWVIDCFMDILNHSSEQAEQLATIIHYKGKATVKSDVFEKLKPLKTALLDRGLSAVID